MPQTLVIGDIHGCYEELQALLDRAGLSSDDAIISLGDLVDRGPASPAVWRFFAAAPQARAIMGNHERKHVRHRRGELKPALSQKITRRQFAEEEADYDTAVNKRVRTAEWGNGRVYRQKRTTPYTHPPNSCVRCASFIPNCCIRID